MTVKILTHSRPRPSSLNLPAPSDDKESVEEAYELIIQGLRRSLHRYGLKRARGLMGLADYRELVEEVADETFMLALARRREYDPEKAPLLWWLFLLGRKQMVLELRRLERDRRAWQACREELGKEVPLRGQRAFRQVLERDRLGRALSALSPDQLQALGLFYLLELSLEEVGRLLGRTPEAVSSLLQRARKSARARLEGQPTRTGSKGDRP